VQPSVLHCKTVFRREFAQVIFQPVRLRLSAKSASQPAVFFSHKKPANGTFSQPDQPKRIGCLEIKKLSTFVFSMARSICVIL
jgi:hypothetical protein